MTSPSINKYKVSRKGRKLQISDAQTTLLALPKDIPERTWAEVFKKEENDQIIFEIREDILDEALRIGYEHYMEKQQALFTAHCAAQAWLKLIDWYFYRHDPGEDPSAYPPCFIPKRVESWVPDEMPDPSPKDSWAQQDLNVIEDISDESIRKWPSSSSLDVPVVEEISSEYWFPGKVNVSEELRRALGIVSSVIFEDSSVTTSRTSDEVLAAESEVLQKVTDYSTEELSAKVTPKPTFSKLNSTSEQASLKEAGDSAAGRLRPIKKRLSEKSKAASKPSMQVRSKNILPPLDIRDSRSRISAIPDCRLRNLRLDTQYEISSEKMDPPPGQPVKRK